MDPQTRALLEAPVTRTILRLALPNVMVTMVQASIGLIETYFVAELGLDALAGIALVFPLFMLLQMVSAGAMGGGIQPLRAPWARVSVIVPINWFGPPSR